MNQKFRLLGAHGITQYLRGELFVWQEFVLSNNTDAHEKELIDLGIEFLKVNLQLIAAYFKELVGLIPAVSVSKPNHSVRRVQYVPRSLLDR